MHRELLLVGHRYFSHAGNLIEIAACVPHTEEDGTHAHRFHARVLTVVRGHDALLGRVMHFDAEGHWISPEGITAARSIHNLKEVACDDAN